MAVRVAELTVRLAVPVTAPFTALMVAVPVASDLTHPLLAVATLASEELQVQLFVMSWVLPLLKVPVADNCTLVPTAMCGFAGLMAMETRVGAVTVTSVELLVPSKLAVIVVVPSVRVATEPLETVATAALLELQVALKVMSWVDWSLKVPVATKGRTTPVGNVGFAGVTDSETTLALVTFTVTDEDADPDTAVITLRPAEMPFTRPKATVATAGCEELQLTESETFCAVPSVSFAIAVHCSSVL